MTKPVLVLTPFDRYSGNGREQARSIIAGHLSVQPDRIQFEQRDSGKPVLHGFPSVHIGISHSRDILAVYIGPENAGIDVEFIKARTNMEDMARIICTDAEFRHFKAAGTEQIRVFYEFWTRKEAEIKRAGGGLSDLLAPQTVSDTSFRHWLVTGDYMVGMAASQRTLASVSVQSRLSPTVNISPLHTAETVSGKI